MPARNAMLGVVGGPVRACPDHDDGAADAKQHQPDELATLAPAVLLEVDRHALSLASA